MGRMLGNVVLGKEIERKRLCKIVRKNEEKIKEQKNGARSYTFWSWLEFSVPWP